MKSIAALVVVCVLGKAASEDPPGTLIDKLSLSPSGGQAPSWTLGEGAVVDGTQVKLTTKAAKAKGTLWSNEQCHADQWEAQFQVAVDGESETPGKGFGF